MFFYALKHRKKPADLNIKNNQNFTPMLLATKLGRVELLKHILELLEIVSLLSLYNYLVVL
jgi:hypothetical protein